MNEKQKVILAIAPGKRELGIAVFANADLMYGSVKTLRHRKSRRRMLKEAGGITQKLIESFSVQVVVIKSISQYQRLSPDLKLIVRRIKYAANQEGAPVREISLEEIKTLPGGDKKATEKKAFEMLVDSYPELGRYWNRPNKWQNDYYAFLFSAVAVGAVYLKTSEEVE